MTIKDVQKVITHWCEGSASDIRSARLLLAGRQFVTEQLKLTEEFVKWCQKQL